MAYQVEVKIEFRAGHRLIEPYKGKCNNPHGEGYTAIFIVETDTLDKNGMVMDFGALKKYLSAMIDEEFDHAYIHHVDDVVGKYLKEQGFKTFEMPCNPTAENIAELLYLFASVEGLKKVGVIESFSDSIAWYEKR